MALVAAAVALGCQQVVTRTTVLFNCRMIGLTHDADLRIYRAFSCDRDILLAVPLGHQPAQNQEIGVQNDAHGVALPAVQRCGQS